MTFSELDQSVLFEDDHLLVINKPPGWVVNRSQTHDGPTIQDWMEKSKLHHADLKNRTAIRTAPIEQSSSESIYGSPEEIFLERGGVVHRLDKDTSGVMALAKDPGSLSTLLRQFRQRETKKTYLALIHGKLIPGEGTIRLPMGRSLDDRKKFAVSVDGKESETAYRLVDFFPGLPSGIAPKKGKSYQGFSLVELTPKTGRTHQIRVHMAAIHHPLVGDQAYAGKKRIRVDSEWCPRQFLHAYRLCISHPMTKKEICFQASLPDDLTRVLSRLRA